MRFLIAVSLSLFVAAAAQAQSGGSDTPAPSPSPSTTPSQPQSSRLSDAEALRTISAEWNDLVGWLLIGERRVAADAPHATCERETEVISVSQYDFLLNAERAGLVTISYWDKRGEFLKEKDYTNKEKIDFFLSGRLQKMTILPTKEAQQEQVRLLRHNRTGCMSFKVGDYKIEKVTENRPLKKGETELAAVSVAYSVEYRAIYRKTYTAGKVKIDNMRKANVLLRFDPSARRWYILAFDAANIGEEIRPQNIPAVYERLQ